MWKFYWFFFLISFGIQFFCVWFFPLKIIRHLVGVLLLSGVFIILSFGRVVFCFECDGSFAAIPLVAVWWLLQYIFQFWYNGTLSDYVFIFLCAQMHLTMMFSTIANQDMHTFDPNLFDSNRIIHNELFIFHCEKDSIFIQEKDM